MSDLIYCIEISDSNDSNYVNTFRYTQNQRRKELKLKWFRDIINNNKENIQLIK